MYLSLSHLDAVGKTLFEQLYRLLSDLIQQCEVYRELWTLLLELRRNRKSNTFVGRIVSDPICKDLLAFDLWLLNREGKKALLYPFSLPRLEFFQRFQQIVQKLNAARLIRSRRQSELLLSISIENFHGRVLTQCVTLKGKKITIKCCVRNYNSVIIITSLSIKRN